MRRSIFGLASAAALLVGGTAFAAEGGTWVAHDGNVHAVGAANAVFIGDEDAERFDLSELRDGETRVFGSGERAVTATRSGDTVSLTRSATGGDVSRIDVACELDTDTCTVLTFPAAPDKVMVAIEKERVCVNGEGDCDHAFGTFAAEGHVVVDIDCDGEDCENIQALHLDELADKMHNTFTVDVDKLPDGDGESRILIRRIGKGGPGENVVFGSGGDVIRRFDSGKVVLRCTEGDSTITVDLEEADDTFLCPKHSTPMEKVVVGHGHGSAFRVLTAPKIEIKRDDKPKEY